MFKLEVKRSNYENQDLVLKVITLTDDKDITNKYIPSPCAEIFKVCFISNISQLCYL